MSAERSTRVSGQAERRLSQVMVHMVSLCDVCIDIVRAYIGNAFKTLPLSSLLCPMHFYSHNRLATAVLQNQHIIDYHMTAAESAEEPATLHINGTSCCQKSLVVLYTSSRRRIGHLAQTLVPFRKAHQDRVVHVRRKPRHFEHPWLRQKSSASAALVPEDQRDVDSTPFIRGGLDEDEPDRCWIATVTQHICSFFRLQMRIYDQQPEKAEVIVPYCHKRALYNQYMEQRFDSKFRSLEPDGVWRGCTEWTFNHVWSEHFPYVKCKHYHRFSVCGTCKKLNEDLAMRAYLSPQQLGDDLLVVVPYCACLLLFIM